MIELSKALVSFQKECPQIELDSEVKIKFKKKDGTYSDMTFNYASLPYILKTVKPILTKFGLCVIQKLDDQGINTVLMHETGQMIESGPFKIVAGAAPKDQGASATYARRYSLCALLGIVGDADKDSPEAQSKGKKPITNKAFDQAVSRILDGDTKTFIQVLMHFELTEDQMEQLFELSLSKVNG